MYRSALWAALLAVAIPVSLCAQTPSPSGADSIISYFTGKQVVANIDMPGNQKGIDLRFNKPAPTGLEGVLLAHQAVRSRHS